MIMKPVSMRLLITICFVLTVVSCSDDDKTGQAEVVPTQKSVDKLQSEKQKQVEPITTQSYTASVVPANMTVQEKKQRFAYLVAPAVEDAHKELMQQYTDISEKIATNSNHAELEKLKKAYKAKTSQDLLKALKPHPQSIVIAQAAMESAWGTSRFFREANNIFGVWSFDKNEPRIAASKKRGNKTIWLKKYSSIEAAVKDYYRVIARGDAFKAFRDLKMKTNDPYELVKKLDRYSEKGDAYGKELASMIRYNKFDAYDL